MVVAQDNTVLGGGALTDTDWMPFSFGKEGSSYIPQFVLCVKGYSKIGIKCGAATTYMAVEVYTAEHLSEGTSYTDYRKSSSETLIQRVQSTSEIQVDVSAYDYIWLYWPNTVGPADEYGRYRLIV